jgi:hypothetical protein
MADNTELNLGSGGDIVAMDDIGGVKHQRVKVSLGADGVGVDLAQTNPMPLLDHFEIARGNVAGLSVVHQSGRNTDVDTGASEDLWPGGGTWVPPTTGRVHDIASTDAADDSGGTGARTVVVEGLSAAGELQSETVELNGTSNVATSLTWLMIHRMYVETAGSGGANAGAITATAQSDATVTTRIDVGVNSAAMGIYQIPASTVGYLTGWHAGVMGSGSANVDFELLRKDALADSVWRPIDLQGTRSGGASRVQHAYKTALALPALTLIKVRATTFTDNQAVFGGFEIVLDAN